MIAAPGFVSTRFPLVGEPIALVKTSTGKEFGRAAGRQTGDETGRKLGTAMAEDKPPFPPFTRLTATQKVRAGEDGWNGRDPVKAASAYTVDSWWRNRSEFVDQRVDITLYDTFAATPGDREDVHELATNPRAGKVVVYSWDLDEFRVKAAG